MWLDISTEAAWKEAFEVSGYPSIVILNPGKRKRYVVHEGEMNLASLSKFNFFV